MSRQMKIVIGSLVATILLVAFIGGLISQREPLPVQVREQTFNDASSVSFGQVGRLKMDELERVPVVRDRGDLSDLGRAIREKDLLTLNQMMDGGRLRFYERGSRIEVSSIRGKAVRVKLQDGTEGWILDSMVGPP